MTAAKREFGRTGLQVTTLGYGAMELRGAPRARDISEEQAETILNKVLDSGINYIDTSIDYGLSEERIGRYISHRRSEYYLASCGCLVGAPPAPLGQRGAHVFTRDNVVAGVEQSLVRMRLSRRCSVPCLAIPADPRGARRTRCAPRVKRLRQSSIYRHVRYLAQPDRPHCDGRLRRLSDPVFGSRA